MMIKTNRLISFFIFFLTFSLITAPAFSQRPADDEDLFANVDIPVKRIVYIYDSPTKLFDKLIAGINEELDLLGKGKYDLQIVGPESGNRDPKKIRRLLKDALADPEVDIIVGEGLRFTVEALKNLPPKKPIIIADFINHAILGAPYKDGKTGVKNLYYLTRSKQATSDFNVFRQIVPFKKLHIIIDQSYFAYAKRIVNKLGKQDYRIYFIPGQKTASETLKGIDFNNVEAIYLAPEIISPKQFQKLIGILNERKIPTFSFWGYEDVERGVLAGRMPIYSTKFIRRIALIIDRVLMGEDAGTIPVEFEIEDKIAINQKTADEIGVSIPFNILSQAEVLFQDEPKGDLLTLKKAVDEAVESNWIFSIRDEEIKQAGQEYLYGLSEYLPKAEGRLDFNIIDSGRASHSGGALPKRTFSYGLAVEQLIFSDPVIKNIQNTKKQIKISRLEKETSTLNVTQETIDAYLAYLKAKALLKVERDNYKTTEVNLDIARKRQKTGVAGPEEVYRWEAEISDSKAEMLTREAEVRQARVVLNQLMNRPQETLFEEQDIGLETLRYYIGSLEFAPLIRNMNSLQSMLDYSVTEAFENAPELQTLNIGLEIQENLKKEARNRFLLPQADMLFDISQNAHDSVRGIMTGGKDDSADWRFNMRATYPLWDRGQRFINVAEQNSEYRRIQFTKFLTSQEIELDTRIALYNMYHSYPAIRLTRDAMISSQKNFEVIQKKYSTGIASVTDLTNAQNFKFQNEGNAMVAIYSFLSDLASFDRAISKFYLLAPEAERKVWLNEVQKYINSQGS